MRLVRYIFPIIFLTIYCHAQSIKDNAEELLQERFTGKKITFEQFPIPREIKTAIEQEAKQRFFKDEVYLWKVLKNDSLESIAILDNVYGKELPITFMVSFDELGSVINTDIIKYRSTRGGDVQEEWWLDQFLGFNDQSIFQVGNTVDAISGATYSVSSLTKGIHKLTLLVNRILEM